jgi:hypothetical protein
MTLDWDWEDDDDEDEGIFPPNSPYGDSPQNLKTFTHKDCGDFLGEISEQKKNTIVVTLDTTDTPDTMVTRSLTQQWFQALTPEWATTEARMNP